MTRHRARANGGTRFAEERSGHGQHGCEGDPRSALDHADCSAGPPYPLRGPPDSLPNTGVKLRSSIMLGFVSFNSLFAGAAIPAHKQFLGTCRGNNGSA